MTAREHSHRDDSGQFWEPAGLPAFLTHMAEWHPDYPATGTPECRNEHHMIHSLMDVGAWPPKPLTPHEQAIARLSAKRDAAQADLDRYLRQPVFEPMPNPFPDALAKHFQQMMDWVGTHDLAVESDYDDAGNLKITVHATPRKVPRD